MFGLLFQLLFWGGIIGLVVWLVGRDKKKSDTTLDMNSPSYAQGYWDGYRAHQREVAGAAVGPEIQPAVVSMPQAVYQTPVADNAAEKEKHDLQNINTTLYVASFLLVAAAALFVGTALPQAVKFIGIWAITVIFYVVGLGLHAKVSKLRPAAVAFTGTGLALLPFAGWAMYQYVLPDAALCWLITSSIGLLAFVYATLRLQSQVVAYFAIAFMVSLLSSSVAAIDAAVLWYFVVLIGFGACVTLAASLKPTWLPKVFSQPIQQSGQWIVPLTLLSSLLFMPELTLWNYVIIFGISTLYYAAVTATTSHQAREVAFFATRLLASVFVLLLIHQLFDSWLVSSCIVAIIGAVQVGLSTYLRYKGHKSTGNEIWLWKGFALIVIAPLFATSMNEDWAVLASWQVALLLATAGVSAVVLRRAANLYFSMYALIVLPFMVGYGIFSPIIDEYWIAIYFLVLALTMLYARATLAPYYPSLKTVMRVGYGVFAAFTVLTSGALSAEWNVALWLLVTASLFAMVYLERQRLLMIVASLASLATIGWAVDSLNIPSAWSSVAFAAIALVTLYSAAVWLREYKWHDYSRILVATSLIASGLFAFSGLWSTTHDVVFAAGGLVTVIALLLAYEGTHANKYVYYDAALVVGTIGLQRMLAAAAPGIDGLIYTHWWAITAAGLAYLYYHKGDRSAAKTRFIIGLSFLSFFGGIAALGAGSDEPYRLIFLIEHALLLAAGLHVKSKLITIWGAVGVVLAVLWMLSGYTFLLLFFIGLVLIAGAIYALTRQTKR